MADAVLHLADFDVVRRRGSETECLPVVGNCPDKKPAAFVKTQLRRMVLREGSRVARNRLNHFSILNNRLSPNDE